MNSMIAKRTARMALRKPRWTTTALITCRPVLGVRTFSVQPKEEVPFQHDLVKDCIKGIMDRRRKDPDNASDPMTISDQRLEERFQEFQSLLSEARACIADCKDESDVGDLDEETKQASQAVDAVFDAYLDLVDDLRSANPEQQEKYSSLSGEYASELKLLRKELDLIFKDAVP